MKNPVGFSKGPVTAVICAVYLAFAASLLYTHHVVPRAPKHDAPVKGINLTEAFGDLQTLASGFHPYNSRKNDEIREWLLRRIGEILKQNKVEYVDDDGSQSSSKDKDPALVTVFNDNLSNISIGSGSTSVYFEGTNILVYIRGSADDKEDWWRAPRKERGNDDSGEKRGVLVNAHYDSVSTGLGATDDGVGVVSILQLIKYYTTAGHQPKRGLLALLNNGEEDFLNGAYAFTQHPISRFPDTFLNLEGAGAGGRATLFRSTDLEVTRKYGRSPYPFGSVISSDSFDKDVIRSQTDYVVFNGVLGMRGLDVAFFEPRSRYHTIEDSARGTNKDSVWHMLSAAIATTKGLTSDTTTHFASGPGSRAVWFDLFGRAFGVLGLNTLFGLSVSLLVVTPLFLIALVLLLQRSDKWYLFARKAHTDPLDPNSPDDIETIEFGGWRGLTRSPIALLLAFAVVLALAFLITKLNPMIVYSSQYAIWSMMLSAWFTVAWFFLRGADFMRPSALHRAHSLGWIYAIFWVLLVASAAAENGQKIAGVYFIVILFACAFLALSVSYIEFFGLPPKQAWADNLTYVRASTDNSTYDTPIRRGSQSRSSRSMISEVERPGSSNARTDGDPTETTALLGQRHSGQGPDSDGNDNIVSHILERRPFGEEQMWSGNLQSWLWLVQFLVLAPVTLIIVGPIALFATSAMHQTLADGNSVLTVYIVVALLTVILLLPVAPFLHRISSKVPAFLFLVFVGTLIYNLVAFPFSETNQLKVFFRQDLDLETGTNVVTITGFESYVQQVVATLPSSGGQTVNCSDTDVKAKSGLTACRWHGLAPNVIPVAAQEKPSNSEKSRSPVPFKHWLSVNATRVNGTRNQAVIKIKGLETRSCRLLFDEPVADFDVKGSALQDSWSKVSKEGAKEIRLWHREWNKSWTVRVTWNATQSTEKDTGSNASKLTARAACLWNNENEVGTIPALDEVRMYMPLWSTVTKVDDGLVVGYKDFTI